MADQPNIAILILAAGESKRMGERVKQLLPYKNTTLLGNALNTAKGSQVEDVFVVLGANEALIKKRTGLAEERCIYNEAWNNGMGSSIAVGLRYILSISEAYEGILVMLADQPLFDAEYLNKLIATWNTTKATISATGYQNGGGVPAVFAKNHFAELLRLTKDYGARNIIKTSHTIIVDPQGKELDIDTWKDYQKLVAQFN